MTSDTAEAFLGDEQSGGSPPHHHLRVAPALDAARPRFSAGKTALDEVGCVLMLVWVYEP